MPWHDFTLDAYSELLSALGETGYDITTVRDYISSPPKGPTAIMRHDVDRRPKSALRMARLESSLNICSTYYFRYVQGVFKEDIIREIEDAGHEIGYHYEVIDKTRGDQEKAIKLFREELETMRRYFDVQTACIHGSATRPVTSAEMWREHDISRYGITGEAYMSIDMKKIPYFSDTGRRWDGKYTIMDHPTTDTSKIRNTREFVELIKSEKHHTLYISTHPNRWSPMGLEWLAELMGQNAKNMVKMMLRRKEPHGRN